MNVFEKFEADCVDLDAIRDLYDVMSAYNIPENTRLRRIVDKYCLFVESVFDRDASVLVFRPDVPHDVSNAIRTAQTYRETALVFKHFRRA